MTSLYQALDGSVIEVSTGKRLSEGSVERRLDALIEDARLAVHSAYPSDRIAPMSKFNWLYQARSAAEAQLRAG